MEVEATMPTSKSVPRRRRPWTPSARCHALVYRGRVQTNTPHTAGHVTIGAARQALPSTFLSLREEAF
eukprot:1876145-Pyramimonas_sp.AAC.1